jgi:signal transduction histidine kinase
LVVPDLKKGGLVASIDELVGDLCFDNLFEVDFRHSKTCDIEVMTQTKKITLFRIVQEQMKNIVKYSKAKKVLIALNIDKDRVRLEIKDDGEGFDPKGTRRGIGLSNIYERTRLYNGKAMLTTAPGKGCSIIVSIPFEDRDLSH